MVQHDQSLDNQQGEAFRTDLNNALAAVFGNSSGATQPTVTQAGQLWFDTSSGSQWTLRIRNGGNSAWIRLFDIDATTIVGMGLQAISGIKTINSGPLQGLRNALINGDFDIWQRAITQTTSAYGSVDRWYCQHSGSTKTVSRQAFALGQIEVPGNPKYYMRTVVASVAGAGNYVRNFQNIEGARTFAGKTVTVTFYAKADAAKNMSLSLWQQFGTGGSPSAAVNWHVAKVALTTAWKKFTFTTNVPSIESKVFGTSNTDAFTCVFWFDAGSANDANTGALGQQSGTFDVAHVSIVEGDATLENDPFSPRPLAQEIALCSRHFEKSYNLETIPGTVTQVGMTALRLATLASATTHNVAVPVPFRVRKRATPTMTYYSPATGASGMGTSYQTSALDVAATGNNIGDSALSISLADTRAATEVNFGVHWVANSEV